MAPPSPPARVVSILGASLARALVGVLGFVAFRRLGYRPEWAAGLVAVIVAGGRLDLPLTGRPARIGLNVGGGGIPLVVAGLQAAWLPSALWGPLAAATGLVALLSFACARRSPGRGIVLPWALPGLLGAALGLILAPAGPAGVAYVAGTVGPLVGADLAHLPRLGPAQAIIGGGGAGDGLLWSGLLAACLAAGG